MVKGWKLFKTVLILATAICVLQAIQSIPPASAVDTYEKQITLNFYESDFKFIQNGVYTAVHYAGANLRPWESLGEMTPGNPALPVRIVQLALPPDARVLEVAAETASSRPDSPHRSGIPRNKLKTRMFIKKASHSRRPFQNFFIRERCADS